jgi:glycosyltransferase involved in cell wall biosynthesis
MTVPGAAAAEPMRPLTIIQVFNHYLAPGGEENSVIRIAEDLESGGHQVVRFWQESTPWIRPGAPSKPKQVLLIWRNPAVLEELRRLQLSTKADLWLLHNVIPVVSLGIYGLARELNVPIVQWLHNYRPFSPSGTLLGRRAKLEPEDRWIAVKETLAGRWKGVLLTGWLALGIARAKRRGDYESVRAWVAVSEEMKGIFARARWYPDRLHYLRHAWHMRAPKVSDQDEGHFLFLGRMVDMKGARFLLDLWRHPALQNTPLVMGGLGPVADEWRGRTPPNIRWVGYVEGEEKRKLLAGCRGVLFPCLWAEPLSTVAYESYDAGKPVLASRLGGMKEIVVDGRTGRLLEPGNASAWLEAITHLDSVTARGLGLGGRQWLEENVSVARWNEGFNAIVNGALPR